MPEDPEEITEYDHDVEEGLPNAVGFVLTAGDVEIFKFIFEHRFLRREHISALTGRPAKRLHRRLFKLIANGYLTAIRLPQQKHIYALGKAALPVLVEEGIANTELLGQRLRTHELKELFLKHEMMIVDLHVMFSIAGRTAVLKLVDWREGKELFDYVTVADHNGTNRLPIRPDAFFILEDSRRPAGQNRAPIFLEADRSTGTQTRFTDKIRAYWNYLEQGLHTKKFNIKNFRVLTVTITHERALNLSTLAKSLLPDRAWKYYRFTSLKNFSIADPTAVYNDVYLWPRGFGSADLRPLVPPPGGAPPAVSIR